jgi:hypothetical protein
MRTSNGSSQSGDEGATAKTTSGGDGDGDDDDDDES